MSDVAQNSDWWQASDGKWYPPELHPDNGSTTAAQSIPPVFGSADDSVFGVPSATVFPAQSSDDAVFGAPTAHVFPAAASDDVFGTPAAQVFPTQSSDDVFAVSSPDSASPFAAPAPAADSQEAAPVFPNTATDQVFGQPHAVTDAQSTGPAAYPDIQYPQAATGASKSKLAAGLLGIFLGSLGIHRFYLGYKKLGILMLLISVVSLARLLPLVAVWGLVEGVLILTNVIKRDAYGVPLK